MGRKNKDVLGTHPVPGPGRVRFIPLSIMLTVIVGVLWVGAALARSDHPTMTAERGQRLAEAALAYAEVTFVVDGEEQQGMPYAWGGRTGLDGLKERLSGGDGVGVLPQDIGVDASGLVVAALRDIDGGVRFFASATGDVRWADATSALLYEWNTKAVDIQDARAGDVVFFGSKAVDGRAQVEGVGVVTAVSGSRVDFVVASAGQGRVVHTFARADGEYWQNNILGIGRLTLPDL